MISNLAFLMKGDHIGKNFQRALFPLLLQRQVQFQQVSGWDSDNHNLQMTSKTTSSSNRSLRRLLELLFIIAARCFCVLPFAAVAQSVGHNNQLEIRLADAREIQCDFSLNVLPLLHSQLAPKSEPAEFLQRFSSLPDPAMDKELGKLIQALSAQSFFILPTGAKLSLKQWELPSKQLIREAMKVSLFMMQMPPNAASHIDPMLVQAKATNKVPVTRVQLKLHPAFFPIFVANKEDKFWLTPEIPTAIMDLQ